MEKGKFTPQLFKELLLLNRSETVEAVKEVLNGNIQELCIKTRYTKQIGLLVGAVLSGLNETEQKTGNRCRLISSKNLWEETCLETDNDLILIATPPLNLEYEDELIRKAKRRNFSVIYSLTNPRLDKQKVVELKEPSLYDVKQILEKHGILNANNLAQTSKGNIYSLIQRIQGKSERDTWSRADTGTPIRFLALLGGWNEESTGDKKAIEELINASYDKWVDNRIIPLAHQESPPITLEGKRFRPIPRYETWHQLAGYLTDKDFNRFKGVALKALSERDPDFANQTNIEVFRKTYDENRYSKALKEGISETLAIIATQANELENIEPNTGIDIANETVSELLKQEDWLLWASLGSNLSFLAEASPNAFLGQLENAINKDTLKELFGKGQHCSLLWALEVLAWFPDLLPTVCKRLIKLSDYELPKNLGNTPLNSLRAIFLPWMPQTNASIQERGAAMQKIISWNSDKGWDLLLEILPESHQSGSYSQRPIWRQPEGDNAPSRITRASLDKQVEIYADFAIDLAKEDVERLATLIKRCYNLPQNIFDKIIEYIQSEEILNKSEDFRFKIWETLNSEISRHTRFEDADWSMLPEDIKKFEEAANKLQPKDPLVIHRWLFNKEHYDLYKTDNYKEEDERIEQEREAAIKEIIDSNGIDALWDFAKSIKHPRTLGQVLGQMDIKDIEKKIFPHHLTSEETYLKELARGYSWSKYFKNQHQWMEALDTSQWTPEQTWIFFASLPFKKEVWRKAKERLGEQTHQYWSLIYPNPYQAEEDMAEAAAEANEYGRHDIAIDLIHSKLFHKEEFLKEEAIRALQELDLTKKHPQIGQHEILELIKKLQELPDIDLKTIANIELKYLGLLDRSTKACPKFLELHLANNPQEFHNVITICYKSEKKDYENKTPDESLASHLFTLIYHWRTIPGTQIDGTIDIKEFKAWLNEAETLCKESGHWPIAQQMIGQTFANSSNELNTLLQNKDLLTVLDKDEHHEMRNGLRTALYNSRDVHYFTLGRGEQEIAKTYHEYAKNYRLAGFTNMASMLDAMADGYERDAKVEARRRPFSED